MPKYQACSWQLAMNKIHNFESDQMRRIFAAQFWSIPLQYFDMISIILWKLQSQFQRQEKFML